jgi:hypothetical protein
MCVLRSGLNTRSRCRWIACNIPICAKIIGPLCSAARVTKWAAVDGKETGMARAQGNERVEIEMKIMKYRALARGVADDLTAQRIATLIAELEQKLREIDE